MNPGIIVLGAIALYHVVKRMGNSTNTSSHSINDCKGYYWDIENEEHRAYMDDLEEWTDDDEEMMRENYRRSML